MPLLMSWSMSSPCSLPLAATEPKMVPMSVRLRPLIWAVSPTVLRTLVICSPEATPEADRLAATVAASPSPKAVPLTAAIASFIISVTSPAECPSPLSLAWAFSIARALSKPPLAARPTMPPVRAPMVVSPALPTLVNAPPSLLNRLFDPRSDTLSIESPRSPSIFLPKPRPEGSTCTYTVPTSCAIGFSHHDCGRPDGGRTRLYVS